MASNVARASGWLANRSDRVFMHAVSITLSPSRLPKWHLVIEAHGSPQGAASSAINDIWKRSSGDIRPRPIVYATTMSAIFAGSALTRSDSLQARMAAVWLPSEMNLLQVSCAELACTGSDEETHKTTNGATKLTKRRITQARNVSVFRRGLMVQCLTYGRQKACCHCFVPRSAQSPHVPRSPAFVRPRKALQQTRFRR